MQHLLDQAKRDHEAGRYTQAVEQLQLAVQQAPDAYDAYQWLARSLAALGRYDEAVSVARRALELNPMLAMPRVVIGAIYLLRDKRLPEAHTEFMKAVSMQPDLALAHQWLARSYEAQGQFPEAEKAFRAAIELAPDRPQPYVYLGALYLKRKRSKEAISMLAKAVSMAPADVSARITLGSAYVSERRFREARTEYWNAFRLHPSADALCGLTASFHLEHRLFMVLTLTALLAVTIVVRSIITVPLIVLALAYFVWAALCGLRSGSRKAACLYVSLAIAWAVIYVYNVLRGF